MLLKWILFSCFLRHAQIFGWTPKEAALHLVPGVYTTDEVQVYASYAVFTAVLNP